MKKNYLYILGEQVLFIGIYIFFLTAYPERFYSTRIVVGMAFMNFGLLLSRLTFLFAEKHKEKYGKSKMRIVEFLIVATITNLSTLAVSYFAKEPINIKTFCFFVQMFVSYIYLTRLMALKFQEFLEGSDTDIEDDITE